MTRAWFTSRHRRWLALDGTGKPPNRLWVLGPPSDGAGGEESSTPEHHGAGSTYLAARDHDHDQCHHRRGRCRVGLCRARLRRTLSDGQGKTIFTASGNFSGGVYTFQLPALAAAGATDATYTLHVVIE